MVTKMEKVKERIMKMITVSEYPNAAIEMTILETAKSIFNDLSRCHVFKNKSYPSRVTDMVDVIKLKKEWLK